MTNSVHLLANLSESHCLLQPTLCPRQRPDRVGVSSALGELVSEKEAMNLRGQKHLLLASTSEALTAPGK